MTAINLSVEEPTSEKVVIGTSGRSKTSLKPKRVVSLVRTQPWSTTAVQRFPVDPSPSYNLVSLFMSYLPTLDLVAAFSIENLLNQDYEKYMCCSSESGYVVPSPREHRNRRPSRCSLP